MGSGKTTRTSRRAPPVISATSPRRSGSPPASTTCWATTGACRTTAGSGDPCPARRASERACASHGSTRSAVRSAETDPRRSVRPGVGRVFFGVVGNVLGGDLAYLRAARVIEALAALVGARVGVRRLELAGIRHPRGRARLLGDERGVGLVVAPELLVARVDPVVVAQLAIALGRDALAVLDLGRIADALLAVGNPELAALFLDPGERYERDALVAEACLHLDGDPHRKAVLGGEDLLDLSDRVLSLV